MKKALVLGAGGFIGGHLARRLQSDGVYVRCVDLKNHEYFPTVGDEFVLGDLRDVRFVAEVIDQQFDEIYQLAADMGGAGYIFSGDNDAVIMHNSATVNLNIADRVRQTGVGTLFYSSSACVYPEHNQLDPMAPITAEASAYPAAPDSEYGWEKLFSERMFLSFARNFDIPVRIARFHNVFGPFGTWTGGREKAPAAICRKVAEVPEGGEIEIWGDGEQTRSFLYIDECLEAVSRFMDSDFPGPMNIGSSEMLTINRLVSLAEEVSGKRIHRKYIAGPMGVRGRTSNNSLIRQELGWEPSQTLEKGIRETYNWVASQVLAAQLDKSNADLRSREGITGGAA